MCNAQVSVQTVTAKKQQKQAANIPMDIQAGMRMDANCKLILATVET